MLGGTVKKNLLKKAITGVVLGASALLSPCVTAAAAETPSSADDCAKELLLSYFPEPIVNETLKRFNVDTKKWAGISKSLASKDKEVVKTVEEKASSMNPNPLKDPQQRQAAVKLFRDTLLQVFTAAMKENGINDTSKFQAMLDDIQQQKAKMFAMCMEKHKQQAQKQDQAESEDNDDNDDDDDGDDEDEDEKEPAKPMTKDNKAKPA